MKKTLLSLSLAAVLLSGTVMAASSFAEVSSTTATSANVTRRQQWANNHPQRAEKMKEHHAKMQAMTPEERAAHKAEWATKHPEQASAMQLRKEEFSKKHPEFSTQRETWKNLPQEERKVQREQWLKNHPEERQAVRQDMQEYRKERRTERQENRKNGLGVEVNSSTSVR
ncbi:MAG: hypothetical protein QE263_00285 [Vampirovibrionales bacterium]|nr:hypothetical protein [Vampirovibrionales bacterium]